MTLTHLRLVSALTALGLFLGWSGTGSAQDKPADKPVEKPAESPKEKLKDDDLERLLDKLEEPKADPSKDKDKNKDKPDKPRPKDEDLEKLLDKVDPPKDKDKDKPRPAGGVAPGDKDLDKLLEGLGQTNDKPAPDDKKPNGPGSPPPDEPKDGQPKPDKLTEEEKKIDDHLIGKTGKKPKKEQGDQKKGQQEGEGGPLGEIVKEMRDVEERLGKTDTGEETRKKQTEIVKNLDQLIEQMKNSPGGSKGLKMLREGKKPGQPKPGQPGTQPGAMAQGTGMTLPEKPKPKSPLIEMDKKFWGNLPAQYRDEIDNVLNEHPLPTKEDLIRLYYLSLGKKTSTREN